jgi:hypothetical protein
MTDQARLSWALAFSLLLHLTVLTLLPILSHLRLPAPPPSIDVDLTQLPAPPVAAKPAPAAPPAAAQAAAPPPPVLVPKRQIVTPPDAGEERPPKETRLLSDRDNAVEKEMVRRGQPLPGNGQKEPHALKHAPAAQAKQADRPPEQVAALPKLDQLLPRAGDLIREGLVKPAPPPEEEADVPRKRNLFAGSGGAFSAQPGINDFLPSIREGDITLLNTKAELFAPFVRRVALRIFQHLAIRLKQAARRSPGGSGREFAEVEAIMSKSGQLLSARLIQRESNSNLAAYRELMGATQPDTFFDANPPPGAEANDGKIHFILLVDLMVQSAVDPRTGAPSTGYYGVAGVGLDTAPKED